MFSIMGRANSVMQSRKRLRIHVATETSQPNTARSTKNKLHPLPRKMKSKEDLRIACHARAVQTPLRPYSEIEPSQAAARQTTEH